MDGNLYDEFGNYIGPEIDDDEEEMGFVHPNEDEEMQDQGEPVGVPEEEGIW
jgi:U5 small nuclear ribonucleoprotein component